MFRPWKFPWPWRWLSNQICQALPLIGGSSNWPSMKLTACGDSTWKLMVGGSFPILSFWGKIMPFLVHPWITCHSCFFLNNAEMLGRMNGDLQRAKVIAHRRWVAKMGGGKKQAVGKGNCLKARVKIDMCLWLVYSFTTDTYIYIHTYVQILWYAHNISTWNQWTCSFKEWLRFQF